jgi:hypothetical protein
VIEDCPEAAKGLMANNIIGYNVNLWELSRMGNKNEMKTSIFHLKDIKLSWTGIIPENVGETTCSTERISDEGTSTGFPSANCLTDRIISAMPDYHLFDRHCQNFAEELVRAISPKSNCPKTIQNVLAQWRLRTKNNVPRDTRGKQLQI